MFEGPPTFRPLTIVVLHTRSDASARYQQEILREIDWQKKNGKKNRNELLRFTAAGRVRV